MKKLLFSIIILLIFGAAVFILGWLEFFVPVDKVGVLISKTGGVHTEVIEAGGITWSWERLIPTNSKIRIFSCKPQTYTETISGSLPSADIYNNMLEGNPSFDYSFSVDIVVSMKASSLPVFVKRTSAEGQSDLDAYVQDQADSIARSVIEFIITNSMDNIDFVMQASLTDSELIEGIDANSRYSDLNITSIKINNAKLPDITMYNHAKSSYAAYQEATQQALEGVFELEGFDAGQDYLELERLSRLGRVLKEYPNLIEFMAVSNGNLTFNLPSELPQIRELNQ